MRVVSNESIGSAGVSNFKTKSFKLKFNTTKQVALQQTGITQKLAKLSFVGLVSISMGLTGCQTFKNLTNKESQTVQSAEQSEQGYYQTAISELEQGHYAQAIEDLTNLRTFYPTGAYAEQALLDMMYAQFESGEYAAAATSAEQFIRLYPTNPQVSYAYYVRGVANMQGASEGFQLLPVNQAERDTSYYRLAFGNFQELIAKYPSSPYAPDAAQRMTFIYNQFAQSEMAAANWYIEREAYVAAANRAKWVFQYYPLSESVPDAIATLAYSYQKLGMTDLANQYKTLLTLNYPEKLTANGEVIINAKRNRGLLNKITFGKLGRSSDKNTAEATSSYVANNATGATKQQVISNATQLQLPMQNTKANAGANGMANNTGINIGRNGTGRGINIGLGLPDDTNTASNSSTNGTTNVRPVVDPNSPVSSAAAIDTAVIDDNTLDSTVPKTPSYMQNEYGIDPNKEPEPIIDNRNNPDNDNE